LPPESRGDGRDPQGPVRADLPAQAPGVRSPARVSARVASSPFSVALCSFNGARYLRAQLDSIAAQSRPPAELVVCDDASTDGTPGIVEAFGAAAPFAVRLERNAGNLGTRRN